VCSESKGVPLSATKKVVAETPVDEFEAKDLRTMLHLKVDHSSRPLWVVGTFSSFVNSNAGDIIVIIFAYKNI